MEEASTEARSEERPLTPVASTLAEGHLAGVVEALCVTNERLLGDRLAPARRALPSRGTVEGIVNEVRAVLFPAHFGVSELGATTLRYHVGARLDKLRIALLEQVRAGLAFTCQHVTTRQPSCQPCDARAQGIVDEMILSLPRQAQARQDRFYGGTGI